MKKILLSLVFVTTSAGAKTNIEEKIEQLRVNKDASRNNLKQYEDNQKTVEGNLSQVNRALDSLKSQKQTLFKQTGDVEKGKKQLNENRKKIQGWLKAEESRLKDESAQIAQLRKTLETLEKNKAQREQAIAAYQEKLSKADNDANNWTAKKQEVAELEKAISDKEAKAMADKKEIQTKRDSNNGEIDKWRKQVRVSDREYDQFSKLK